MTPQFDNTEIAFKSKTNNELRQAQFLFSSMGSPFLTNIGLGFTKWALHFKLPIKGIIKSTIFKQFCGGESMIEAATTAQKLAKSNIGVILDYGVEGKQNDADFDAAVPEFVKAIDFAASEKNIPFISIKVTGFCNFDLLAKIHAGASLTNEENLSWKKVYERINTICAKAHKKNIKVLVDAEESWIQDPIDWLCDEMMRLYNKEGAIVYNTYQLYLKKRLGDFKKDTEKAKENQYILGAKLVRGAYMEKERLRASEMNYPSPVQDTKENTDNDYNIGVEWGIQHINQLELFIGTHNENSCQLAIQLMKSANIEAIDPRIYFSQLFGMSDNISFNLSNAGYHVAKYLPYGPVEDVMPYLMRRAQENTSVAGQTGRELSLIRKELKRRKS
jgi:proline dehydrogenase